MKVDERGSRTDIEVTLFVASRFVVHLEADGRGLDTDVINEVLEELELEELAEMGR